MRTRSRRGVLIERTGGIIVFTRWGVAPTLSRFADPISAHQQLRHERVMRPALGAYLEVSYELFESKAPLCPHASP